MPSLRSVDLSYNSLTSLPSTAFEQCPNLNSIDVQNNPLNCSCDLAWTSTVSTLYSIAFPFATCHPSGNSILDPSNYVSCQTDEQECFNASIFNLCLFECVNTVAGYHCQCPDGYVHVDDNMIDCREIDECSSNGTCAQICTNTLGSFECSCVPGFRLSNDNSSCDDINECGLNNTCSQICINIIGSYECNCTTGFRLSSDNSSCDDIDECSSNDTCAQMCTNTPGSYECSCVTGFRLSSDNSSCDDIDECSSNDTCAQMCTNTPGSYECSCVTGFRLSSDNSTCDDIDECEEVSVCISGCINTIGSYMCRCAMDNPFECCPLNHSYCPETGCCLDNIYNCPPTLPPSTSSLTVSVGNGSNYPLVLTIRSFPTVVLCSINSEVSSNYDSGFIELCDSDWKNCRVVFSAHPSNFIYTTFRFSNTFSFGRCRFQSLTELTLERDFIVTPHPSDTGILSQLSANNIMHMLAWNISGNCSLNCPDFNVDIFFQSHPDISLVSLTSFQISCSVYGSLHWFSYSYYKLEIDFPEFSIFGENYLIRTENSIFGSLTQNMNIPFPSNLYCNVDFQYGVLWDVTSVGVTTTLNCSYLLPNGSNESGLVRSCGENGVWSDVISECSFPNQPYNNVS